MIEPLHWFLALALRTDCRENLELQNLDLDICHKGFEEEIVVKKDEANETVIKVDVETEDEGSGGENLISKEDFLKLMAKHREESKADRAKFFQDLRKDLWTDR